MNKIRDKELLELMNSLAEDESMTWIEKLQRVIDFKKAKRGLRGFHCSTYPKDLTSSVDPDQAAYDIFMMEKVCVEGNCVDVTDMPL